jgi:hypothetical protein
MESTKIFRICSPFVGRDNLYGNQVVSDQTVTWKGLETTRRR